MIAAAENGWTLLIFAIVYVLFLAGKTVLQKLAQGQPAEQKGEKWQAPEEQVRDFLQQLTGEAVRPAQPAQPQRKRRQRKQKPPEPQAAKPVPAPERTRVATDKRGAAPVRKREPKFQFDVKMLRNPNRLRQAVVIREILDPPLAMRPRRSARR